MLTKKWQELFYWLRLHRLFKRMYTECHYAEVDTDPGEMKWINSFLNRWDENEAYEREGETGFYERMGDGDHDHDSNKGLG